MLLVGFVSLALWREIYEWGEAFFALVGLW